jgi:hypothetical protein
LSTSQAQPMIPEALMSDTSVIRASLAPLNAPEV